MAASCGLRSRPLLAGIASSQPRHEAARRRRGLPGNRQSGRSPELTLTATSGIPTTCHEAIVPSAERQRWQMYEVTTARPTQQWETRRERRRRMRQALPTPRT